MQEATERELLVDRLRGIQQQLEKTAGLGKDGELLLKESTRKKAVDERYQFIMNTINTINTLNTSHTVLTESAQPHAANDSATKTYHKQSEPEHLQDLGSEFENQDHDRSLFIKTQNNENDRNLEASERNKQAKQLGDRPK